MAETTIRQKSAKGSKETGQVKLKTGIRILVADLVVGHKIVTSWKGKAESKKMSLDEVMDVLSGGGSGHDTRYVATSKKVESVELCASQWRTHRHINKNECYDERSYVWIVNE